MMQVSCDTHSTEMSSVEGFAQTLHSFVIFWLLFTHVEEATIDQINIITPKVILHRTILFIIYSPLDVLK